MSFTSSDSISGDLVNTTVDGRFIVECVIGSGATGVVYRARHTLMAKSIALKVIQDDVSCNPKAMDRFKREIQAITMLDHESIVKPMACGLLPDGRAYLAMDLVDGMSIAQSLEQGIGFSQKEVATVAIKVSLALAYAHKRGVVHRDVSPRNIVLIRDGDTTGVRILDFGISALVDNAKPAQSTTGAKGSPHYMSPEQCLQEPADARSDVYSLGCVMYEMLSGQTPYQADSAFDLMYKHAHEPFPSFPNSAKVDRHLVAIVARCMEKQPARRYADMEGLAHSLEKCLKKLPVDNRQNVAVGKSVRRGGQKLIGRSAVLIMALSVAGVGVMMLCASEPFTARISLLQMRLMAPAGRLFWLESEVSRAIASGHLELAALLNEQAQALPGLRFYQKEALLLRQADIIAIQGDTEAAQERYLLLWRGLAGQLDENASTTVKKEDLNQHLNLLTALFARLHRSQLTDHSASKLMQLVSQSMLTSKRAVQALPLLHTALPISRRLTGSSEDTGTIERTIGLVYLDRMKKDPGKREAHVQTAAFHFRESVSEFKRRGQVADIPYAQSLALQAAIESYFGNRRLSEEMRDQALEIINRQSFLDRRIQCGVIAAHLHGVVPDHRAFWFRKERLYTKLLSP